MAGGARSGAVMTDFTDFQKYAQLDFRPDPACTKENLPCFNEMLAEFCQGARFAYAVLGKTKAELIGRQSMLDDDLARRLAEEFDNCADMAGKLMKMFEEAERCYLIVLANRH
jgi:hypothetical protein